jgi:hypothetical protein
MDGEVDLIMVPVSKMVMGGIVTPENNVGLGFLKAALQEYVALDLPFFHIPFHSPAMTSVRYQKVFSQLLSHLCNYDASFCLLSEVKPVKGKIAPHLKRIWPYLVNLDVNALSYILSRARARSRVIVRHGNVFSSLLDVDTTHRR